MGDDRAWQARKAARERSARGQKTPIASIRPSKQKILLFGKGNFYIQTTANMVQ
jgi:hypothetical protein